jgi:hypothetical protein
MQTYLEEALASLNAPCRVEWKTPEGGWDALPGHAALVVKTGKGQVQAQFSREVIEAFPATKGSGQTSKALLQLAQRAASKPAA